MEKPKSFSLWAKTDEAGGTEITHPLIYHMLDVGECTLALWKLALSEQTRQTFANFLKLNTESTGRLLAFWASLHDIGKAAPGFQRKYMLALPRLREIGLTFPEESSSPSPHGIVSAWALKGLLAQETGLKPFDASKIAVALGGHHGTWPTNDRFMPHSLKASDKGDAGWDTVRRDLLLDIMEFYQPPAGVKLPLVLDNLNTFITLFSGLVSVADWIGSITEYFQFTQEYLPTKMYAQQAALNAKIALQELGWIGWRSDGSRLTFAAMFPNTPNPNPIQEQTFASALECELPTLLILEAPTGIGKTEAALFLADNWLQRQQGRGLYVAMPTQATSNQMFARVVSFLSSRYPTAPINAHLIHSGALLSETGSPQLHGISQDDISTDKQVKAESWFLPRKRTLLAPFGIGTVDQALMSVLQTRHFFVRIYGLGQKVVIFDEVHAYDTYMSALFERLLRWLRSIGTSVILLSATLPNRTRKAFVEAWQDEGVELPEADYPRLTLASAGKVETNYLKPPPEYNIRLVRLESDPKLIADHLSEKLQDGGCAAVICNRVRRAQEVYAAIRAQNIVSPDHLILFHARFPFAWREEIEKRVLTLFGKEGKRPNKAIVVATQVIEQSLDLDFDYIISDIAPVDLLLQRAGRLHRHSKNDKVRPSSLHTPCLALVWPIVQNHLPDFGLDTYIYDAFTLLRTWLALIRLDQLILPRQTTHLIETVYGEALNEDEYPGVIKQALRDAGERTRLRYEREISEAIKRLISLPDDENLLTDRNESLDEEDVRVNEALRALTRLGDPSVSIICLYQTSQGIALDPDGRDAPLDLKTPMNQAQVKNLLRNAVSIQRREVVHYIVNHDSRSGEWKKTAALHDHYPVIFETNGLYQPGDAHFYLRLSREFGLEVFKPSIVTSTPEIADGKETK